MGAVGFEMESGDVARFQIWGAVPSAVGGAFSRSPH